MSLKKAKRVNFLIAVIATAVNSLLLASPVVAKGAEGNNFFLQGSVSGDFKRATCSLNFNKYGKVWTLRVTPEGGYSPAANLFFSPKFGAAQAGEYPVKFSYRGSVGTLGGSVTTESETYSNDTDGTVNFTRFDDRVVGTFAYSSNSSNGESVSASGAFDCMRGGALQ
ncbi:MAG: hypothetical protein ACSHXK_10775 [Oceanococcus sp.]